MFTVSLLVLGLWAVAHWSPVLAFAPRTNLDNATFTNLLANITNPSFPFPPQFSTRKYFYVGGDLVSAPDNASQHEYDGLVYVEQLTPALPGVRQPNPIVLLHGSGASGTVWLDTPDQRQGWADMFLYLGYAVFIVDLAYMGRSPRPSWLNDVSFYSEEQQSKVITASEKSSPPGWPQAKLHNQWPGAGVPGDPIFDTFYRQSAAQPGPAFLKIQEQKMRTALTALLKKIGRSTIVAHSLGALGGWQVTDSVPELVSSLVLLEPTGPPFENVSISGDGAARGMGLTNSLITYDPPLTSGNDLQPERVGDGGPPGPDPGPSGYYSCVLQKSGTVHSLKNIGQVKELYVLAEASFQQTWYNCTLQYLRQAGVSVDLLDLKARGIKGNGHYMFLELNSRQIFGQVARWIYDTQASQPNGTSGLTPLGSSTYSGPVATSPVDTS